MPRTRTYNEADFSEIFYFAEAHSQVGWNECCAIFFNTDVLLYKSHTDLELANVKELLANVEKCFVTPQEEKALKIIQAFMEKHNLEKMRVEGD